MSFWGTVANDFKSNLVNKVRHTAETGAIFGAVELGKAAIPEGPVGIGFSAGAGFIVGGAGGALMGVITTGWQAVDDAITHTASQPQNNHPTTTFTNKIPTGSHRIYF